MALSVAIYASRSKHQTECGQALAEGLRKIGISPIFAQPMKPSPADIAVIWGHRQDRIIQEQRRRGLNYLVMERGYFRDRFSHFSLGWNGLNGRADFRNKACPPDRWLKHGWELPPWKSDGEYVLVMGQVLGDASLAGLDYPRWLERAFIQAAAHGLPVKYRRHPQALDGARLPKAVTLTTGNLLEDLAGAALVVTLNSNSAVDAVLTGTPAVACDRGSMAWDVCGHSISDIVRPDREQWANDLAYAQWTLDEIAAGESWRHLKTLLEQAN